MRGSGAFRTSVAPGGVLAGPWVRNPLWTAARAVPSLDLDFAGNKSLKDGISNQDLITHTRASSATFVDSSGVLRSAVTNLLLRSEEFDNASWNKVNTTVTANSIAAPNGTVTADTITDSSDASAAVHSATSQNQLFTSGLSYTLSVYARGGTQPGIAFLFPAAAFTSNLTATFNISDGTIISLSSGMTGSIVAVGNGWYRCSVTATATTTASSLTPVQIRIATASTSFYQGNGTGTISLWGAQLEQASTVGDYVPTTSTINSAPRFDHNPTTGESLGLLVEEARTNSIRNNTGVGAVAGTPGTLPTNWSMFTTTNGLSRTIVGTGTENNITYIDLQISGTATANVAITIANEPNNFVAAANGQSWTYSAYVKLVAGSFSGFNSPQLILEEYSASATYLAGQTTNVPAPTTTLTRLSATRTNTNALTAFEYAAVRHYVSNGNTVDITLRIGLPQLELGAFATSPILTSSATVTRAADVAQITGANFSSWYNQTEGTVFVDGSTSAFTGTTGFVAINAAATTNRFEIRQGRTTPTVTGASTSVVWTPIVPGPTLVANTSYKQALAFSNASHGNSLAGGLETSSTTIGTIAATQLMFGVRDSQTAPTGGSVSTIKRLTYWPTRLSNEVLQRITQP